MTTLRNTPLFRHLNEDRLSEIEAALTHRELADGEILFELGDPGDALVIVEEGEIIIYTPNPEHPGEEPALRSFSKNEVLGEMALIDRQPRSKSARAQGDAVVGLLDLGDFRRLLADDPEFAMAVMEGLSDRIRYTTAFLDEVRQWVVKVSDGNYESQKFADDVTGWVRSIGDGDYDEANINAEDYKDETLSALAQEFAAMATRVKKREEALKQEITKLKIEIDEQKRKEEVETITKTDFFLDLKNKASEIRKAMKDD